MQDKSKTIASTSCDESILARMFRQWNSLLFKWCCRSIDDPIFITKSSDVLSVMSIKIWFLYCVFRNKWKMCKLCSLFFYSKDSDMSRDDALKYGTAIYIISVMSGVALLHYFFFGFCIGMKLRVAVCSLVYRKVWKNISENVIVWWEFIVTNYLIVILYVFQSLQLSQRALSETAPGKLANLLSNDVNRFEIVSLVIHPLWTSPLMTIVATYILWQETRWAGMIGLLIVFLIVPIQSKWITRTKFVMNIH